MFGFKKAVDQVELQVWSHIVSWFEQGLVEVREAAYINEYTWDDQQWVLFYEQQTTLAKTNLARVSKGKLAKTQLHVKTGAEGVKALFIQIRTQNESLLVQSLMNSAEGMGEGDRRKFRSNLDAAKVYGIRKKAIRQVLEESYWESIISPEFAKANKLQTV